MRTFFCLLLSGLLAPGAFTPVQGQRPIERNRRETLQQEQLKKLMSKVGVEVSDTDARAAQPQTYRELKIRWVDSTKSNSGLRPAAQEQTQTPSVSVIEDKKRPGTLPRQRSLELSPTQIFVAAVDAANKLRWWSIMPDPRLVRSETRTASGELRGEDYYVSNVTLLVAFPDDPEIARLRFYHPVWNGTQFDLKPLTNVATR